MLLAGPDDFVYIKKYPVPARDPRFRPFHVFVDYPAQGVPMKMLLPMLYLSLLTQAADDKDSTNGR